MQSPQTRESVSFFYFFFLCAIVLLIQVDTVFAANRDVCGSCTYTTIDDAIAAAQTDDVIRVASGPQTIGTSIQGARNLTFEGGYDNIFSTRDPINTPTLVAGFTISFHTGDIVIDGFTINGGSSLGVYVFSENTNIIINNCNLIDQTSSAIMLYDFGTAAITNNYIAPGGDGYGAIMISHGSYGHTQVTISGNTITGQTCSGNCYGIYMSQATSDDIIDGNNIFGNDNGIILQFSPAGSTPSITNNIIAENSAEGLYFIGRSPTVEHNIFRDNGNAGVKVYSSVAAKFYNNIFARNYKGLYLSGNNGTPDIRNNIFYQNSWYGVEISGTGGWGSTNTVPTAFSYNCFYAGGGPAFVDSNLAAGSYSSESPGSYGDINSAAWAEANFKEDPHFVDADNNDFHFLSDSFLVDQGDPASSYVNEPGPNGSRINVGLYGNTSSANTSQSAPTVANVAAAKSGSDIVVTYDTNSVTAALWTTLEYWNGSSYVAINPAYISGTGYTDGYQGGRASAGLARELTVVDVHTALGVDTLNSTKIRVTVEHAGLSDQAESGTFSGTFTPPSISLTAPPVGVKLTTGQPEFTATASDGDGIASVKFYFKGNADSSWILLSTDTSSPYAADWGSVSLTPGDDYDFQAVATDILDNTSSDSNYGVSYCSFDLSASSFNLAASGSTEYSDVTASNWSCPWSADSDVSWITTSSSATGSGRVDFTVQPNSSSISRSGNILVGGKTITITQQAQTCSFSLSSNALTVSSSQGSTTVSISTTPADCVWEVDSDSEWASPSAASGTGNADILLTYQPNSSAQSRTAVITFSGQTFSLNQQAAESPNPSDDVVLKLSKMGTGTGIIVAGEAACNEDCSSTSLELPRGSSVTLIAEASDGMEFIRWIGGDCNNGTSCTITANDDLNEVTAVFALANDVAIIFDTVGNGSIAISPKGRSCGEGCYLYAASKKKTKSIRLEAKAFKNYVFTRWRGACHGKSSSCHLTIQSQDKNVTATFRLAKTKRGHK